MPQVIAAAVIATATWVGATVGGAVATITGSLALGGYVSTALYYGTQFTIYAGLSAAMAPKVPKQTFGMATLKQSRPIRRRGYGRYRAGVVWALWDARLAKACDVGAVHDGQIDAFEQYFLHDDAVTVIGGVVQTGADGRYWAPDHRVLLQSRLGLPMETAYAPIIAAMGGAWTLAHRGDGVASIMMLAEHGKAANVNHDYPYGEPLPSAVIRAQRVFDPRDITQDEADPSSWKWSKNPVLGLMHFLAYDRGYAYDWSANEVATFNAAKWARRFGNTLAYWVQAADDCDEAVDLAGGDTAPRYEIGGQYEMTADEASVINQFLVSMDGWLSADGGGGLVVYAGKFSAPAVTLTDSDVLAFTVDYGVELENQVNEVVVTYTNPANKYNESEAPPWTDDAAVLEVGKPQTEELDLPWVQSLSQARRLAKRRMERHQASCRGTMSCALDTGARSILGKRFLAVDLKAAPATLQAGAVIEVTGNMQVDLNTLTVSFQWVAVDVEAREGWTPAEDEGEEPGVPDDTPAEPLEQPTITAARVWFEPNGSLGLTPRISADVAGPLDRADLTWEIQWRKASLLYWQPVERPETDASDPTPTLQTGYVQADTTVAIRVRYQTGGGQYSPWSDITEVDTSEPVPTFDSQQVLWSTEHFTWDGV